MIVNDIYEMERIVANNDKLHWNNYDVWLLEKQSSADLLSNGVYIDGDWYIRTIFPVEKNGWNIPEKLMK